MQNTLSIQCPHTMRARAPEVRGYANSAPTPLNLHTLQTLAPLISNPAWHPVRKDHMVPSSSEAPVELACWLNSLLTVKPLKG